MSLTLTCCLSDSAPETQPASRATVSLTRRDVIPWPGMFPPLQPRTLTFISCGLPLQVAHSTQLGAPGSMRGTVTCALSECQVQKVTEESNHTTGSVVGREAIRRIVRFFLDTAVGR